MKIMGGGCGDSTEPSACTPIAHALFNHFLPNVHKRRVISNQLSSCNISQKKFKCKLNISSMFIHKTRTLILLIYLFSFPNLIIFYLFYLLLYLFSKCRWYHSVITTFSYIQHQAYLNW